MIEQTIAAIIFMREEIDGMDPFERLKVIDVLMTGYCRKCGQEDPEEQCQCWNDE